MMKDINKKFIVACSFLVLATPIYSQSVTLSLEQCRKMALEKNVKILNAHNDIDAAEETRKSAFTNFFPTVSASGMGFNADKGTAKMVLGQGMEMEMMKNGITGSITAVQPVFAGGQIINGNKLAKLGVDVGKLQLRQSENEVALTVEKYYWQLVTLQEKLKTVEVLDIMLQSLLKDVTVAVNAGVKTRNDLLQVELKSNEIAVNKINLINNISLSKMLLAQYVGISDSDFELASNVSVSQLPATPDGLYREPAASLPSTSEYKLLEKNVEATELQRKIELGKNLPSVGVGAGYMYHDLLDNDRSFGLVFATVSVPISSWWGGSHNIKKQKIQLQNAKNEQTDKSQLLVIKMQKAWNDVNDAYKQMDIAKRSIEQSAENLRLNNDYYHAGTSTMSDLLDAQSMYQQSRDKFVDTYSDYKLKIVEYLQSTGR